MYTYMAFLDWQPWVVWQPFILVINEDFGFGRPVSAFWQWSTTASGDNNVLVDWKGAIDRVDATTLPSEGTTYGMFYETYYPFDVVVGSDLNELTVTMYEKPKSDSDCTAVATFTAYLHFTGRTKAVNYDPVRMLPVCRFYDTGFYLNELFKMIVPDDVASAKVILVYYMVDSTFYGCTCDMSVTKQDGVTTTVKFDTTQYSATMTLDMNDDYWTCSQWDSDSSLEGEEAYLSEKANLAQVDAVIPVLSSSTTIISKPPAARSASVKRGAQLDVLKPQASNKKSFVLARGLGDGDAITIRANANWNGKQYSTYFWRTTSTVQNDTNIAILCTLEESDTTTKAKVLAGLGMFLGALGILPLGALGTPVGVMGAMLAGVGLYDTLNEAESPSRMLLFPNENMARTGSGGLPFTDNNDLTILVVDVKDKNLRLRAAVLEKLGSTTTNLASVISDDSLFTNLMEIAWDDFDDKVIQACKLVKIHSLVPVYNEAQSLAPISDEVLYSIDDGQLLLDNGGYEGLYNTLINPPTTSGVQLFQFSSSKNAVLFHAYIDGASRSYDVIRPPGSRVVVLKMTKCRINVDDSKRNPLGIFSAEDDAIARMVREGGWYAYSWRTTWNIFGYKFDDLTDASIDSTNDALDIVYIPIAGWLPWQRVVSK